VGITATISSDIESMRVTDAKVVNYSFVPAFFSVWIVPVTDTSTANEKASLRFKRVGAFETLLLDEIIGQYIEGGGTIRTESDTATTLAFTASGTSYPLGYE
jgi:hypothetical protein